ncbi:MAG: TRAP transporter fused permease subunit [Burkholderiales bacterium]|nr:TRAP transporter fused permease subunit [Burkholderiales bacterium]
MNLATVLFSIGQPRHPKGAVGVFTNVLAAAITIGIVAATTLWVVDVLSMLFVFLGPMLALIFLLCSPSAWSDPKRIPWPDFVAAALALATSAYFFGDIGRIALRIALLDPLTDSDLFFGTVLLVLVLEGTRRTVGLGLLMVVLAFLAYNLWGDALPGVFGHGRIDFSHFLDILVFTTDGVFGVPLRVALTYVFLFALFGSFLHRTGGGEFFFNVAAALSGRTPGGPAKIAVVSSGLFGTISGSPTSDVIVTGSVTIPMMKRLGYSSELAGGVEVAASTGGSLLPPVMGSAAFIMAEFTGIRYQSIVVAAIVPALLYYFCVYYQVHLRSLKIGLRAMDPSEIPSLLSSLRQGGIFAVPLLVLIVTLLMGYSPSFVAVYATLGVIAVAMLRTSTRLSLKTLFMILAETARRMTPAVGACAAAGLVVGGISMTGLGAKFTDLIFLLAGAQLFWSLVIAAIVMILLGMGMPVPSVYILGAVLVAPALIKLGVPLLAAHLFLLYYASLSAMTPPVAVAAFAAAPIAEGNPMLIGVAAVKLAVAAFVIPFSFAYSGEILLRGEILPILLHVAAALLAVVLVSIAVEGFLRARIGGAIRLAVGACGLALLASDWRVQLAGAIAGFVLLAILWARPVALQPQAVKRTEST